MQEYPSYQDIVLVGGGHAHAIVLQMWAMNPLPGARLTLVSPQAYTAYSGMLPGLVAGHYTLDETHIDLVRLCRAAGARFVQACAHRIDLEKRCVSLLGRPDLEFDLLSLDVGATPERNLPGSELAIPVKPIGNFHRYWQQLQKQVNTSRAKLKLGVVGGGAGGCELAMAMAHAMEEQIYSGRVEIHLLHTGRSVPEGYPPMARMLLARELARLGVKVHRNWTVAEITREGVTNTRGEQLQLDRVALCTQAAAPPWLADSGLDLDTDGFVRVDPALRASGSDCVYAAGDVASFEGRALPKAGVYAVRQGPILYHNLRAALLSRAPKPYRPQRHFLSLISCGGRRALAARNGLALVGGYLWQWKDRIDRRFMQRFSALPLAMGENRRVPRERLNQRGGVGLQAMRCNGCGAKVGAEVLSGALRRLPPQESPHLLRGAGDDAAVLELPPGKLLVQSSDQLRALVQDPWLFGRLAALHALSDLFAMHAQPVAAQALVTLPLAAEDITRRDLQQLLDGAAHELNRHGCALAGGHTSEGAELQLGFTVNGIADAQQILHKTGVREGDCLILSKPLGVGTLFAADAAGAACGNWMQRALTTMLTSNARASEIFAAHGASALTDITGFGLLGHLLEMLGHRRAALANGETGAGPLGAVLFSESLPLLPGAAECVERGLLSSLHPQNAHAYTAVQNPTAWSRLPHWALLVDPQTCGGLLAAVPAERARSCLQALRDADCAQAAIVGSVQAAGAEQPIRLANRGDSLPLAAENAELVL